MTLTVVLIWSIVDYKPIGFGDEPFPSWAQAFGWFLLLLALILIPIFGFLTLKKKWEPALSFCNNIKASCEPSEKWRPQDAVNCVGKYAQKYNTYGSQTHSMLRPDNRHDKRDNRRDQRTLLTSVPEDDSVFSDKTYAQTPSIFI